MDISLRGRKGNRAATTAAPASPRTAPPSPRLASIVPTVVGVKTTSN